MPFRDHTDELIESAANWLLSAGRVKRGDVIAIAAGMPIAGRGQTNFLKLHASDRSGLSFPTRAGNRSPGDETDPKRESFTHAGFTSTGARS